MVYQALLAAKELEKSKIETLVINSHTIKPLDEQAIIRAAKITGAIVTAEEHQVTGGLGGAVAELLAKNHPAPMGFVGMSDGFGESGQPNELLTKYNMKSTDIVKAVKRVLRLKNA